MTVHSSDLDPAKVVQLTQYQDQTRFPLLNEVEAYWRALGGPADIPSRAQLDPRGLERALRSCMLLEQAAPEVARCRLAGQHLHDLMGMDISGMPLSALFAPDARPQLAQCIGDLFAKGQAQRLEMTAKSGFRQPPLAAGMVLLPLRDAQGAVTRALACLVSDGDIGRAPRRFGRPRVRPLSDAAPVQHKNSETPWYRSPEFTRPEARPEARPKAPRAHAPGFGEPAQDFAPTPADPGSAPSDPRPRPSLRVIPGGLSS